MRRITMSLRKLILDRNSVNSISQDLCVIDLFTRNFIQEKIMFFNKRTSNSANSEQAISQAKDIITMIVMIGACICVKDELNYFRS